MSVFTVSIGGRADLPRTCRFQQGRHIGVCAVVVLNRVQEPVDVAFTTSTSHMNRCGPAFALAVFVISDTATQFADLGYEADLRKRWRSRVAGDGIDDECLGSER